MGKSLAEKLLSEFRPKKVIIVDLQEPDLKNGMYIISFFFFVKGILSSYMSFFKKTE